MGMPPATRLKARTCLSIDSRAERAHFMAKILRPPTLTMKSTEHCSFCPVVGEKTSKGASTSISSSRNPFCFIRNS